MGKRKIKIIKKTDEKVTLLGLWTCGLLDLYKIKVVKK